LKTNRLEHLYIEELKELYSAENQLAKALPAMAKAANTEDLRAGFGGQLEQAKKHVARLEKTFNVLGKIRTTNWNSLSRCSRPELLKRRAACSEPQIRLSLCRVPERTEAISARLVAQCEGWKNQDAAPNDAIIADDFNSFWPDGSRHIGKPTAQQMPEQPVPSKPHPEQPVPQPPQPEIPRKPDPGLPPPDPEPLPFPVPGPADPGSPRPVLRRGY